jgi:D-alanine transaminase
MNELVWNNGVVSPLAEAKVGVEDRGYQFADGVYEVIRLYDGRPFTLREHLERLERSSAGIKMALPMSAAALSKEVLQFLPRTNVRDGMVYLQATRGCAARNHVFPKNCKPSVLFYVRHLAPLDAPGDGEGAALFTVQDERWKKCWIKSIALLANVLAKNEAVAAGADEAVFVEDGVVSECSASNLFVVRGGKVVTHPVGPNVLPGITRMVLQQAAGQAGVEWVERPVKFEEAVSADEVFITSTTREISWVGKWDGKTVGGGRCGPVTLRLHQALRQRVVRDTAALVGAA